MFAMAAAFVFAARYAPLVRGKPFVIGGLYGLILWAVMNLVVLPLRWPSLFPRFETLATAEQLFSHIALVGIPIARIGRHPAKPFLTIVASTHPVQ